MTDVSPTPETPKPKKEILDNPALKFILSLLAWLAPVPVSIVSLQLWFNELAPKELRGSDPFQSMRHSMLAFNGSVADWILPLSVLPSAILLFILYRKPTTKIAVVAVLLVASLGALLATTQFLTGEAP